MLKKIVSLGFILLLLFIPARVHASEYFDREYKVSYDVGENGTTHVTIDVGLTNKTSDYYVSSDKIQLGFSNITNVTARDPNGSLEPKVESNETGTVIEVFFNTKVVGKDNTLNFTIQFDTTDIAKKQGNIWEINIPGIADPNAFKGFNVSVTVPQSFGEPTYIKPQQDDNNLVFTKNELGTSGISIAYGDIQYYDLDLIYHLQNTNLFPIRTEIALPPTTPYQEVSIDDITPKPNNVSIDRDGNWLAEYHLLPSQKFDVRVRGKVMVHLRPQGIQSLSKEQREVYTQTQKYWETNEDTIQELALKLKTPEKIYEYVVKTLTYDFNRVTSQQPRLGAAKALEQANSAVCLEFTDLFIALARASGIPAREVNGFAYTQNQKQRPLSLSQDILHSWPEYYDERRQQWIMIDPTWGNTTGGIDYFDVFDFDHVVFVTKGVESTYPIPAGGYKFSGDEGKKDVNVSFGSPFSGAPVSLKITPSISKKVQSGLPINGTVNIVNTGSSLHKPSVLLITSSLQPSEQFVHIPYLPPYGSVAMPFGFDKTEFLTNAEHTFTMSHGDIEVKETIRIVPFTLTKIHMIGGIGVVIFTGIIFILARKSWRLRIFR